MYILWMFYCDSPSLLPLPPTAAGQLHHRCCNDPVLLLLAGTLQDHKLYGRVSSASGHLVSGVG